MELLQSHPIWSVIIFAAGVVAFLLVWKFFVDRLWPSGEGMRFDKRAFRGKEVRGHQGSGNNDSYEIRRRISDRPQDGKGEAKGREMTVNPEVLLSGPKDSSARGIEQRSRSPNSNRLEPSPSDAASVAEPSRSLRRDQYENRVHMLNTEQTGRPDGTSERTRNDAFGRIEDRLAQIDSRLASIDRMVSDMLPIILRGSDKGRTPEPMALSRAPQPPVYRPTTLEDIVQFWNEGADWGNPDASLASYRDQIHRDGWWISETVMKLIRVVSQGDNPSKLFLFPHLKKAKKLYHPDFFVVSGSGDSMELQRPTQVQLLQPNAKIVHEIDRLLGEETPLSDVFGVVQKGEII